MDVEKKAFVIDKLHNARGIYLEDPSELLCEPSTNSSELLPSRVLVLNQIMDALKDPSLNTIGIYGTGGVGKTRLAKEVCALAREEELFDDVIMISVSWFPNLRRIQSEIAGFLGLEFDTEDVLRRVCQLYQRLKKGKLLIILDDVWEKLDLHAVGIPFGDECQGCKLLVSSRRKDVLSSEMGSHKDFLVDVLSGEESWSLFRTIVPEVEDPRLNATAIEIAKKCAGLPLLIVLVSLQMKYKALYAWVDILKQLSVLRNEGFVEKVHKVVESRFENLPGEEFKSIFLLCASFAQSNIQIQHLLIYGMGLRLFRNIITIEQARYRLFCLIDELKNEGLLVDGDLDGHVRLHGVVRDAAISIASRIQNSFIGASTARLGDWPTKDCTRISLPVCNIQDLPASLKCPKADLFLLSSEDLCVQISDLLFEGIVKLKVVDFTGIRFATRLPSSLGCLRNLDSLCFHRCRLDNISVIGELTELKFLSFADSEIVELPREIEALIQLKLLDLTNCSKLEVIPMNVISKLFSLEELYMGNTCVRWDEEGNVSLKELEKLSRLSYLELQMVNPKLISKVSSVYSGLRCYKMIVGEEQGWWRNYERSRMLKLIKLQASMLVEDAFRALLSGIEVLYLDEVSGMGSVLDDLIGEGFPQLIQLCIKNDYGIQHLINSTKGSSCNAFRLLELLRLDNVNSLEMICNGPLKMEHFRNLQVLRISNCGKLNSLFSFSNPRCLRQLEEIEVESCENMEAIVSEGSKYLEFIHLKTLKLKNLPHLKVFCKEKNRTERIKLLFHDKITFPNLTSLEVRKCKSLNYVFTRSNVKWLVKLERLEINNCELVEEIIWHKQSEEVEEEGIGKIIFPKLNYVSLKKPKNLKRFSCGFPIEFSSLTELSIHKCPAMKYFASGISEKNTSSERDERLFGEKAILFNLDEKRFPRLTRLHMKNCYGIQHTVNLNGLNSLESLYFEGRSLITRNCNKLKNFLSFSSAKCSTQLLEIEVQSCHNMEAIFSGRSEDEILELTQLKSLKLDNLPHLMGFCEQKEGNRQAQLLFNIMVSFPNLTSLVVENCNSLKYVFTASMVKCLVQLKKLEISNCELVEAIIKSNTTEENGEEVFNTIVFHKLESLSLHGLPNVKMFGCGYDFEFSLLRELSIECPAMENFVSKYSDRSNNYNADEHLFNELVTFSNLESMTVWNMDRFRYLWHEKFILDSFLKLKSLNIANCSRMSVVFLANMLGRILNLETRRIACFVDTSLQQVEMLQQMEVNSSEEVLEFPQLSFLKLKNLPYLTGLQEQGFGVKVSFPCLKSLELCECKNFKYVFTTAMVSCLMQLEKLEINNCESMEEILLSRQFDKIEDIESIEKIVFPKLQYLSLEELPNLKMFAFGYSFDFQSLKELSISYCPVLKNFVSKYLGDESDEYLFNEMATFSNLERMNVSHTNSFKYLWDEKFTVGDSFLKLKSLRIEYCSNLSVVFPSNISGRFQQLEILYLYCCSRVEEIYQYEGKSFGTVEPFYLQDLEIWNLPSLKYIWSKDPPGASTFENLQSVIVVSCKDLMFVFPKSMARRLLQLQHLKIGNSHMEVIIANTHAEKSDFKAPQLTVLQLENLYQMRNLYNGTYTFKCPKLKQFDLYGCSQEMNFSSEIKSSQLCVFDQVMMKFGFKMSAGHKERSQSFFQKEFFHNLEELTLDDQGLKLILSVKFGVEFSKLKSVTLRSLGEESIPLLFGFLRRRSLEKLVFAESYLEEIFLLDDGEAFQNHLRLNHLELIGDDNLKHILKEDSRFNPTLEKLLTLNVEFCESLINIAPSAVSFENLTSLNISVCFKMKNLVTASTAQTMANLVDLKVSECPMMEEIVEKDEKHDQWISFYKLKCFELYDLPMLNSFSSSRNSFEFPLLERVVVKNCFALKNFCSREVITPKLQVIQFQDEQLWKGDLNATIAFQVKSRVTTPIHGGHK